MTAFPGSGDAVDRVGGRLALETALRDCVDRGEKEVEIGVEDTPSHYHLALFDSDGRLVRELRAVAISSSRAVSSEQLDLMVADMKALRPIVVEILAAIEEEAIPESERRALDGNR